MSILEQKKTLAHIYNTVSKELFGAGTTFLKVSINDNVITFQAKHRRSPRSAALEDEDPYLKMEVDFRMSQLYKKKLKEKIEHELQLSLEAVLRDYDGATQLAFTNIVVSDI
ncbi:DUF2294 domain-containing protein [Bacillus sp. A301a_S52]|nr:DUF2294 domain-containing protein [Bacillus sp. A301a_S52]